VIVLRPDTGERVATMRSSVAHARPLSAVPSADDIEASRTFDSGLLGFDVSMEPGTSLRFTSPSDPVR
jgi:hypothetical protein